MKRKSRTVLLGGLALLAGPLLLHWWLLDGIDGWFLSKLTREDTSYAVGYSDRAFREVRVGASQERVLDILGPPLDRGYGPTESLEVWRYSLSPSDGSYRVRVVQFRNEVVVGKAHEFYVD